MKLNMANKVVVVVNWVKQDCCSGLKPQVVMFCTSKLYCFLFKRGRFPRVFGDEFGEKFGDSLKCVNHFVTNFVTN